MSYYKIGIGYDGIPLEFHTVEAKNMSEARYSAYKWMTPDRGYNHIEVKRISKKETLK